MVEKRKKKKKKKKGGNKALSRDLYIQNRGRRGWEKRRENPLAPARLPNICWSIRIERGGGQKKDGKNATSPLQKPPKPVENKK